MWPVISFFGLTIPVGPLFALLSFYVGSDLGTRSLGRVAPPEERAAWQTAFTNATFAALIAGLIGARIGYAARYFPIYLDAPQLLLSIRPGALALLPGLIAGGAVGLLYLARKNVPTVPTSDAVALGITTALAVLSLGRFLTGEGYGAPTTVPWAIDLWGATRHPVQLYELFFLLVALGLLWYQQRRVVPGELFWRAVAYLSLVELGVAAFRADAQTWLLGMRMTQVIALAVLLAALYVLSFYARQRTDAVHVDTLETMQPAEGDQAA
jgi:prolipoprotein diacylglyceryltransferase